MSVTGYLGNAEGELGMGKKENDVGGVFRGPVLEGIKSVEEEMKLDAAGASGSGRDARFTAALIDKMRFCGSIVGCEG